MLRLHGALAHNTITARQLKMLMRLPKLMMNLEILENNVPNFNDLINGNIYKKYMSRHPENSMFTNKEIIQQFLNEVRSGKNPDNAFQYMANTVLAHQMNAEDETTVTRIPENYADHIKEFLKMYGNFSFKVTELIAENDKVYVRWKQTGKHLAEIDGYAPTGKPVIEIASAVYRLEQGKIVEYWIQIDRLGFQKQLESK